jgi:hypothetical protein
MDGGKEKPDDIKNPRCCSDNCEVVERKNAMMEYRFPVNLSE